MNLITPQNRIVVAMADDRSPEVTNLFYSKILVGRYSPSGYAYSRTSMKRALRQADSNIDKLLKLSSQKAEAQV